MGDNETPPEGGQETPPEGGSDEKTFNQADVDRIIKERLERERTRYADYDELKKASGELEKLRKAQMSEQEKKDARIAELERAQADWEAQDKARAAAINEKLIRAEVRLVAGQMGFKSPDDAYRLAELAGVEVGEDGSISGVKKALEELKKNKEYLLASEQGPGSPPNNPKKKSGETDWVAEARQRYGIKDYSQKSGG